MMTFINMLAIGNDPNIYDHQLKGEYEITSMVLSMVLPFLVILFAILAIVVVAKRRFAMKVKRDILALIAEGKINADEAQKLLPKNSKL